MTKSIVVIAAALLTSSGCFQLMAASKCSKRADAARAEISRMKASRAPAARISGRWTCAQPNNNSVREKWRVSQKGNSFRIVGNDNRGRSFVLNGAVERDRMVWAKGKGSFSGEGTIEGTSIAGHFNWAGNMSCEKVEIVCSRY